MIKMPHKSLIIKSLSHIAHRLFIAAGVFALLGLSSCESIYDKDQTCENVYYLQFVFDMNMDFADAFSAKVGSVEVYAFDAESGVLKDVFEESGAALAQEGYRMKVDLEPGNYEFVAWCGLKDNEDHFTLSSSINSIADLGCTMAREYDGDKAVQSVNLHALYHGKIVAELPNDWSEHTYKVPLIKDTNNINLSLQTTDHRELEPGRFTITLNAHNGAMDYNNNVMNDEDIEYRPYRQGFGKAKTEGNETDTWGGRADDEESESVARDVVLAELSTARLIASQNPSIDIYDNKANKLIYSIPIVKWILLMKSQYYSNMDNQEYLDREDQFNVLFYLEPDTYIAARVEIGAWYRILNEGSLGQ